MTLRLCSPLAFSLACPRTLPLCVNLLTHPRRFLSVVRQLGTELFILRTHTHAHTHTTRPLAPPPYLEELGIMSSAHARENGGDSSGDITAPASHVTRDAVWHRVFFDGLPTLNLRSAVVETLAMLEAVGFTEAGATVQRLLDTHAAGDWDVALLALPSPADAASWLGCLRSAVVRHAKLAAATPSAKPSSSGVAASLAAVLAEVQRQHRDGGLQPRSSAAAHDSLFAELADDFLRHASTGAVMSGDAAPPQASTNGRVSVFQCAPLPAATTPATPPPLPAAARHALQHWYAARLYAAVACSTSLATPGPLARLLVAYVHHGDGRLQAVVRDNMASRRGSPPLQDPGAAPAGDGISPGDAALVSARIRGVVAGILEYALSIARVRTAVAVAALRAASTSAGSAAAAVAVAGPASEARAGTRHVPQGAALLLRAVAEEVGHYTRSAGEGDAAVAVVHAMQELLFTLVLGGGTAEMRNRPEPAVPSAKRPGAPVAPTHASTGAAFPFVVATARGATLAEADVIVQELFPTLVQQLGLEWPWSPLLRHLASLDKQQPVMADGDTAGAAGWVRWSSHALMDAALLALSRKTYPQRLLNILPGSYERLLSNLDLLPPTRPQGEEGDGATGGSATAALFEMPAYYAEPAAALLAYFRRAGVAGLRVEEVDRVLATATSTHAMVVRLRAQAPSRHGAVAHGGASGDDEDEDEESGRGGGRTTAYAYALTRERVGQLVRRYQAEVLLAAVVVHTQLRVPSQVQQLMRALAPLFLKIHLEWRIHHDGSSAAWLLQPDTAANGGGGASGGPGVRFSAEAVVLLDHVGYEFYPLEWLPAATRQLTRSSSNSGTVTAASEPPLIFSYSLCAAVGHQFQLRLRGTPSGSAGDADLRHPAGPRTSVVMPALPGVLLRDGSVVEEASDAVASAAAWWRTERFLVGLMQLCYLDAKTSSTELEGTLAVSSTRRVLTTSHRGAGGPAGSAGVGETRTSCGLRRARVVAAADVATHRLHALLQQPAVMDAMWGSMDGAAAAPLARDARPGQRREKRPRAAASAADTAAHLQAMQQLLHEYGAASFDATVEAADFALVVAQAFLPSSAGTSAPLSTAAAAASGKSTGALGKPSAGLLRAALEWARAAALHGPNKARVNMLLQPQRAPESYRLTSVNAVLRHAYNSATVDAAWLARCVLRDVPQRIWEKMQADQAERCALAERLGKWMERARNAVGDDDAESNLRHAAAAARVNPLLREQWTQWERVLQQLGLSERAEEAGGVLASSAVADLSSSTGPYTADNITCAQWMWYSPYFAAEMSA